MGIGSCLKVLKQAGEHVVTYHSANLDNTQQRWNIVEKEAFAKQLFENTGIILLGKDLPFVRTVEYSYTFKLRKH